MGRQPMTGMDDVERQTIHGDPEIFEKKNQVNKHCRIWCAAVISVVVIVMCMAVGGMLVDLHACYYVAIDSVSDLDPARGLSFNLTLGVASRSYGTKACIIPGTYAEVSYHGVLLATSAAEVGRLCAGPRKTAEQRVAARTNGVPDGHVMDSLAADMEGGAAFYEVTLHLPAGSYDAGYVSGSWVSGCKGTWVGAGAVWCDAPPQ